MADLPSCSIRGLLASSLRGYKMGYWEEQLTNAVMCEWTDALLGKASLFPRGRLMGAYHHRRRLICLTWFDGKVNHYEMLGFCYYEMLS